MPTLRMVAGSGRFAPDGLISFSYSEDATPSNPQDLNGGSGQVNAVVQADEGPYGSRLTIENQAQLVDEDYGTLNFTIKQVSQNEGAATIVGSTVQAALDVDRTAGPYGSNGSGYNLYEAILYYCTLVDIYRSLGNVANFASLPATPNQYDAYITSNTGKMYVFIGTQWLEKVNKVNFATGLQTKLEAINVDFIGWKGNVWEHLKMLCAAVPIDSDGGLLEMYFVGDSLWFRQGLQTILLHEETQSSDSISIESFDSAKEIAIYNYNTSYASSSLIRQLDAGYGPYAGNDRVSITDSIQVEAGETLVKRISVNCSLESVNQPVNVASITSIPYTGSTGEYVIVGKDNIPIQPSQWAAQGGRLTVAITDNPNEIEITLVGPANETLSPYRIGVESSGDVDYPAFYVTGTGVFFDKREYKLLTGAPDSATSSATTIDNPFITNLNYMYSRGVPAAQELCGPRYNLRKTLATGVVFGQAPGAIIEDYETKFRVKSVDFSENEISINASAYVTFADFNAAWGAATFTTFNSEMTDINFTEFTIIPMHRSV